MSPPNRQPSDPRPATCRAAVAAPALQDLAAVAKALSDPIRLRMLDLMARGRGCCGLPTRAERGVPGAGEPQGVCVCEFQEQIGLGQSKTSYHLRVLRDAGLVTEETRGKWTFYQIDRARVALAQEQLGALLHA